MDQQLCHYLLVWKYSTLNKQLTNTVFTLIADGSFIHVLLLFAYIQKYCVCTKLIKQVQLILNGNLCKDIETLMIEVDQFAFAVFKMSALRPNYSA